MNEDIRDPREDISYIKNILARTADGMKSVAPWFTGFGVLWLVYGLLTVLQCVFLWNLSDPRIMFLAQVGTVLGWLFYIALAVGFFIARRRQAAQGLDTLALKLLDMWGVFIILFLVLCVGLAIAPTIAVRVLELSMDTISAMSVACAIARSHLFFLLPVAPLLMTALFLENRRMLWMGGVLAVLGLLVVGCNMLLMYAGSLAIGQGLALGSTVAACLLDLAPGVMLLLFARSLKRG